MTRWWYMIVIIGFIGGSVNVSAISPAKEEIQNRLLSVMAKVRNGKDSTWEEDNAILTADPDVVLTTIRSFEQDESSRVRFHAYWIEVSMVHRITSPILRHEILERLVNAMCHDPDNSLAESLYGLTYNVSLAVSDFSEQAKSWIRQHLATVEPRKEVILLSGIADLKDQMSRLKSLRSETSDYDQIADDEDARATLAVRGWEARLALARMGSQEDIAHCIDKIESSPDILVRVGYLLRHYGYIRQPATIAILQQYLERTERFPKAYGGSCYCSYALDILAEVLEDFPVQADLETARAWMKSQKELKIKR